MSLDRSHLPTWQSADAQYFYVFVYGTLRRGEINDIVLAAVRHGIAEPTLIGPARVAGRLFDYGDWPGMLPNAILIPNDEVTTTPAGADAPTVLGDVYRAPMPLLAVLDDIEAVEGTRGIETGVHAEMLAESQSESQAEPETLEGGAFYRVPCTVRLAAGEVLRCVYYPVRAASTIGCPLIEGGDWIAYRQSRQSR